MMKLNINKILIYFLILLKINLFFTIRSPFLEENIKYNKSIIDYEIVLDDYLIPSGDWILKDAVQTIGFYSILKYFFDEKKVKKPTEEEILSCAEKELLNLNAKEDLNKIECKKTELDTIITNMKNIIKEKYLFNSEYIKIPGLAYSWKKNRNNLGLFGLAMGLNYLYKIGIKYLKN